MWYWYGQSRRCYAYLSDVPVGINVATGASAFSRSRWFTRGWTLQELISPEVVDFYDEGWNFIGRKSETSHDEKFMLLLSEITKIDFHVLRDKSQLISFSAARKMSWASHRITTKVEDMAYSLLGLFGINMPLLYGEGPRAFKRLQEEIIKVADDESIFAWSLGKSSKVHYGSLLASSTRDFENCTAIVSSTPRDFKPSHYSLTNKGLYIETSILSLPMEGSIVLARLNCSTLGSKGKEMSLALVLVRSTENDMMLTRYCASPLVFIPRSFFPDSRNHVYVHHTIGHSSLLEWYFSGFSLDSSYIVEEAMITEVYPPIWLDGIFGLYFRDQPQNLSSYRQNILFLIESKVGPNYVVWFDCVFSYREFDFSKFLVPQNLHSRAAFLEKGKTLAEMIIESKGQMEGALDWHEALDLGDSELCFELTQRELGIRRNPLWSVLLAIKKKETLLE